MKWIFALALGAFAVGCSPRPMMTPEVDPARAAKLARVQSSAAPCDVRFGESCATDDAKGAGSTAAR